VNPMTFVAVVLAAAFAAALGTALLLKRKLETARAELAAERAREAAPPLPRSVEDRRERFSLLWFPTLTVKDDEKLVVSAAAGVPHCLRCVQPLRVAQGVAGAPEEWACPRCGDRRPSSIADLAVTDSIVAESVAEFLARHDGWRAAKDLPVKRER
jgi:hypothetical protein